MAFGHPCFGVATPSFLDIHSGLTMAANQPTELSLLSDMLAEAQMLSVVMYGDESTPGFREELRNLVAVAQEQIKLVSLQLEALDKTAGEFGAETLNAQRVASEAAITLVSQINDRMGYLLTAIQDLRHVTKTVAQDMASPEVWVANVKSELVRQVKGDEELLACMKDVATSAFKRAISNAFGQSGAATAAIQVVTEDILKKVLAAERERKDRQEITQLRAECASLRAENIKLSRQLAASEAREEASGTWLSRIADRLGVK